MLVSIFACWVLFVGSVGLFVLGYDPTQSFLLAGTAVGVFGFGLLFFEFTRYMLNGK
jgi:hypothetical protein